MRRVLIMLFLAGCADGIPASTDLLQAQADLGAPEDLAFSPEGSGEGSPGHLDRCAYAECQGPLDKRVEASNPAREQER